jgi:hypothetical protein
MLYWFLLNDAFCIFANCEQMEVEVCVLLRIWAGHRLYRLYVCAVFGYTWKAVPCFVLMLQFAKITTCATLVKMRCKGGMMMVYGLEQITNVIWNISQLTKSRKSQKLKKSKFGQTLNLNEKGPKIPF